MPSVLQHGSGAGLPAIRYDPGIALLVEGESTGRLYMLVDGEVEVLRGDTRVMVANQPGAIFGEMSVLLGVPHTATVKTVTSSTVYVIDDAEAFLQAHPEIAFVVARLLAQRLNSATTYLVDLKRQFEGRGDHMEMVGDVLESLIHQQSQEFVPGSDRQPDPAM
jgi:CRP/FNR family cyclic AMP-dependent transcriptional regulator